MSRPKYYWYYIVKKMVNRYPELLKEESTPQGLSYKAAIESALKDTAELKNGDDRLNAIKEVCFRKIKTVDGVALDMNYSWRTIQNWINDFINLVGVYVGFTTEGGNEE